VGREFGRLRVVARAPDYIRKDGRKEVMWECICSCGNPNTVIVMSGNLKRKGGGTQSCGCIGRELSSKRAKEIVKELHKKNHKINKYDLSGDYGIGFTSNGDEFWFDKKHYNLIKDYCWYYNKRGYVVAWDMQAEQQVKLHRLIMGINDPFIEVDHIKHPPRDEHKVDNREVNLRLVVHADNAKNHVVQINNSSGISGVHYCERDNKWIARIGVDGKRIYLGSFDSKEEAVKVREEAEIKYHGEYRYNTNDSTGQNDLKLGEVRY
jgi:hypothetical protein